MNKFRGEVAIMLDKERTLKFDANGLASFETEYGKPALTLLYETFTKAASAGGNLMRLGSVLGFRETRALLWAALLHEDEHLTIRQAGDLIDQAPPDDLMGKLTYVLTKVMEAIKGTVPEASKKNVEDVLESLPPDVREMLKKAGSLPTGENSNASPAGSVA